MERIFVADGGRSVLSDEPDLRKIEDRQRKLAEVRAYLYSGWELECWGVAPAESRIAGMTGFFFRRVDDSSGPGFGAEVLIDRLRSGLHAAVIA